MTDARKQILTAKQGSLFVQPDGANTEMVYMGCTGFGTLTQPKGSISLLQCLNSNGRWEVQGEIDAPEGMVTAQLTTRVKKIQNVLDRLDADGCRFAVYVNSRGCGRSDVFSNYDRGMMAAMMKIVNVDDTGAQADREDAEYTQVRSLEGYPPARRYFSLAGQNLLTGEVNALNDIWSNDEGACAGGCDIPHRAAETMFIACDSAAGPATANVLSSTDGGTTWAALAADPFGAGLNIMAGCSFDIGNGVTRILVGQEAPAGGQGLVAYSDDNGATWTTVNIGGAAAGHGALYGGALFALDRYHIWLASEAGYIYFSEDGGVSWTAQESGVISANGYRQVTFYDENRGVAVNDTGGVVAITTNGGTTWSSATVVTGTPALNCVGIAAEKRIWVGTATGLLFYSEDFGTTWTQRTGWTGSGVGQVRDISVVNEYDIFMISNTAGPVGSILRSVNGGTDWEVWDNGALPGAVNSGLNSIFAIDVNRAVAVGEASGGLGVIESIEPSQS